MSSTTYVYGERVFTVHRNLHLVARLLRHGEQAAYFSLTFADTYNNGELKSGGELHLGAVPR